MGIRFIFVLFVIFTLPSLASAERLSFQFLNWGMEFPEMISVAQSEGYSCQKHPLDSGASGVTCEKGTGKSYKAIYVREKSIFFNCNVYNGCSVPIELLVIRLMSDGVLPLPAIQKKYNNERLSWCGVGNQGDKLCMAMESRDSFPVIRGYFRGGELNHVILIKGN